MKKKSQWLATTAVWVAATVLQLGTSTPAQAADVTLKSRVGDASLVGDLVSFEDGVYTISTGVGQFRISDDMATCEGDGCPSYMQAGSITIAGSEAVGNALMPLLLQGFAGTQDGIAELNPSSRGVVVASLTADSGYGDPIGTFNVRSTSSTDAFDTLLDREAAIGMSSRRITPPEARALRADGAGNMIDISQEHVVAVDSILVVVHPDNPLKRISMEQLDRIYSGGITNWAEIGGPNAPIRVIGRSEDTGTARTFGQRIFAESGRVFSPDLEIVESDEAMATAVARDPSAIGFVGHAYKRGTKALALTGACGINAFPGAFSAKTEEYPLQRRLYLYTRPDMLDDTGRAFLDFATSGAADTVVSKAGFIDLGIDRVRQDNPGGRMADLINNTTDPYEFSLMRELLAEMLQYDRLTTTFRFASGSSRLDGKGLLDLERLVRYLEPQPAGTRVALVGFTDSDGAFDANQALSLGRAQQVAQTIASVAGDRVSHIEFSARGYGEFSPSICNDTLDGKRINRRVEVWIGKPS